MSVAKLAGYRTIISIGVSLLLKLLVLKGVITAQNNFNELTSAVTDMVLLLVSVGFDLAGMYFRLKSTTPGQLTPEYKAQQEFEKSGEPDRRTR